MAGSLAKRFSLVNSSKNSRPFGWRDFPLLGIWSRLPLGKYAWLSLVWWTVIYRHIISDKEEFFQRDQY